MRRSVTSDPAISACGIDLDEIQRFANELARQVPALREQFRRDEAQRSLIAAERRTRREAERAAKATSPSPAPRAVRLDAAMLQECLSWIRNRLALATRVEMLRQDERATRPGNDARAWERELADVIEAAADLGAQPLGLPESLRLLREARARAGGPTRCLGTSGPSAHENVCRWIESVVSTWEGSYWTEDRLTDAERALCRAEHGEWFFRCFQATSQSELREAEGLLQLEEHLALDRLKRAKPRAKRTSRDRDEIFRADVVRAESIVRGENDVFPGWNEIGRRLPCGKSKLARIKKVSAYLRQCATATGKRAAKPKELTADPSVLDVLSEERSRSADLRATVLEQERDAKRDRIRLKKVQPRQARGARSADRSGPVR
jgi:hypothetical protein